MRCPSCGKLMDNREVRCPFCGVTIPEEMRPKKKQTTKITGPVGIGGLLILCIIWSALSLINWVSMGISGFKLPFAIYPAVVMAAVYVIYFILLIMRSSLFRRFAMLTECLLAVAYIIYTIFAIETGLVVGEDGVYALSGYMTLSVLAFYYYYRSNRVKNTFVK